MRRRKKKKKKKEEAGKGTEEVRGRRGWRRGLLLSILVV